MPDDVRKTDSPDNNKNTSGESSGDGGEDLERLFAAVPGEREIPAPAKPHTRTRGRALSVAAFLSAAVIACACGAAFFLPGEQKPEYEAPRVPAPAPRVHRTPEIPAAKEKTGVPSSEPENSPAKPGSLGENAKLMNELEAMRLRTRIAREEADYLKAKQAADAVKNGTVPKPAESRPSAMREIKALRSAERDVIISVQGAGDSLWALARTSEGRVVALRPGSSFACGRVSAVTRQGVRIRCQGTTLFISF